MRILILALFTLCSSVLIEAQELIVNVRVETPQLTGVDRAVFTTFEKDVNDFLNSYQFTNKQFKSEERIEVSLNINILDELSSTRFRAEATIQSNRPVFNSNYQSSTFIHRDGEWDFDYAQFEPIQFDPNSSTNTELANLLAYYMYLVIGFDFDSFSEQGGTPYFQQAKNIVDNSQNSDRLGWKPFDSNKQRNRYWMIENILKQDFIPMRKAYYQYHIKGLDQMNEDLQKGRREILKAIQTVNQANKDNPNSMMIKTFTQTKSEEIMKIFGDNVVPFTDKTKVANILSAIDPGNAQKFRDMSRPGKGGPSRPSGVNPGRGK